MEKGDYLSEILRSDRTVFSISDIALLWQESNLNAIRGRLSYYVRNGDLHRIRKNFYAKNEQFNRLELANRLYTPSYISFEVVLFRESMIFQYSTVITAATYLTRSITIEEQEFSYRKIKNSVLLAPEGIIVHNAYSIASRERAFLDMLYISPGFYFDNTREVDWDIVFGILPIYKNKRLDLEVEQMYRERDNG